MTPEFDLERLKAGNAALLRLVLGTALLMAAPASRAPKTIRIFGIVIIVAGLAGDLVREPLRTPGRGERPVLLIEHALLRRR